MISVPLKLYVRDLEKVLFEGEVKAFSSFNEKGRFDVLPMHENFISVVRNKIIIHNLNSGKVEIEINSGIVKVYNNSLEILLGIVDHAENSS